MSQHRSHRARVEQAVNARGAYLLWNPPQSADLNPLEKGWDVSLSACRRRMMELAASMHGASRRFATADLVHCLKNMRLSLTVFHDILSR